jgi:hypothetical protein
LRVAEIVARVAPGGDVRSELDKICKALDEVGIPFPKTWSKNNVAGSEYSVSKWADYPDAEWAVKAINYRLDLAKQRKTATPETLS